MASACGGVAGEVAEEEDVGRRVEHVGLLADAVLECDRRRDLPLAVDEVRLVEMRASEISALASTSSGVMASAERQASSLNTSRLARRDGGGGSAAAVLACSGGGTGAGCAASR